MSKASKHKFSPEEKSPRRKAELNLSHHKEAEQEGQLTASPASVEDLVKGKLPPNERGPAINALQRAYGNQYVQRIISVSRAENHAPGVRTKLTVNQPGDIYEREADRVAEQVVQRQQEKEEEEEKVQTKALTGEKSLARAEEVLQRQEEEEEEEKKEEEEEEVQTKSTGSRTPKVSSELELRIKAAQGSGQPLPESARAPFETHLGHDFSDVRIHTDAEANSLSEQLEARAFTTGNDIFFREGAYQPDSESGKTLIGHEITHVVQQGAAPVSRQAAETEEEGKTKEKTEAKEKTTTDPKVEAISGLKNTTNKLKTSLEREQIKNLLKHAANCQLLGIEAPAQEALKEAAQIASSMLERKTAALNVKLSSEATFKDLLNTAADVQALGGDEKAVESALNKALAWAKAQLGGAFNKFKAAPSEKSAIQVLEKACTVQAFGGDTTEAVDATIKWLEESSAKAK